LLALSAAARYFLCDYRGEIAQMANEPDSLVLVHLREIRATLAEHSARFDRIDDRFARIDDRFARIDDRFAQIDERFVQVDERFVQMEARMDRRFAQMDKRFDRLEQRFDDLHAIVSHTFSLSTANSLKVREFDQRPQFSEGEQQRISGRVDELEHRLVKVEKKLES
jgi:chromosome segregation ATPase